MPVYSCGASGRYSGRPVCLELLPLPYTTMSTAMSFARHMHGTYNCTMITSNGLNRNKILGILLPEKNEMKLWISLRAAVYVTILLQMARRIITKCRMPTREYEASKYSSLSRNPGSSADKMTYRKPRVLAESTDSNPRAFDRVRCRMGDRDVSIPIIRAASPRDLCVNL